MLGKAMFFAGGVGLGMLGQKYGKDVIGYCKNMKKNMNKKNQINVK